MARLPVLMYHDISEDLSQGLTISVSKLEEQFSYLVKNGYQSWFFSELEQLRKLPAGRHLIITFDDAYVNQMDHAIPLLQKYGLKATIFVPLGFVGETDRWNTGKVDIMNWDQLNSLDTNIIELGCHSFGHINYADSGSAKVAEDLSQAESAIRGSGIEFTSVIAYPYGKFPRSGQDKSRFFRLLETKGYVFGCRIGNRVNSFPFENDYEIQRLDIKGEYSLKKFKRKLRYGKLF